MDDVSVVHFEAKSARDGAWYGDVCSSSFLV